jgi:RIO-like serine/threonine protein kinase
MKDEIKIIGSKFPGVYKREKELGSGAEGVIYRYVDQDNHAIAVKKLRNESFSKLKDEASKQAKFMEKIYHFGEVIIVEDKHVFIAMPEIVGEPLCAVVGRAKSDKELLDMAIQFCKGLEKLHDQSITQGDLLYGDNNFLIGSDFTVFFLDFSRSIEHETDSVDKQKCIDRDIKDFVCFKIITQLKIKASTVLKPMLEEFSSYLIKQKDIKISEVKELFLKTRLSILEKESIKSLGSSMTCSLLPSPQERMAFSPTKEEISSVMSSIEM